LADLAGSDQPTQAASRSYDLNAQFHTLLAQASQNPVLEILIALLVGIVWRQLNTVDLGQPPEQHARTAGLHEAIVRAVAARDPAAARHAMLDHLEATRQGLSDVPGSLGGLIQTLYTP
jgi:DNA-binding FadR family transcriptional regulator